MTGLQTKTTSNTATLDVETIHSTLISMSPSTTIAQIEQTHETRQESNSNIETVPRTNHKQKSEQYILETSATSQRNSPY